MLFGWGFRCFSDIEGNSTNKRIYACSFPVGKHLEPQSINAKLFLPIIPIVIVAYAFTLLWDNLCRNSCILKACTHTKTHQGWARIQPLTARQYGILLYIDSLSLSDWPNAYNEFSKSAPVTSFADYTIIMSRSRVIMSSSRALCCLPSVKKRKHDYFYFFRSMHNKTVIGFGFCDNQNNQGIGKVYQPQPLADNPYLDLDYSGYHKNLIQ